MINDYTIYQLTDSLSWGIFNRISLLFKTIPEFGLPLTVIKKVNKDYKIAMQENEETDDYILSYIATTKHTLESNF